MMRQDDVINKSDLIKANELLRSTYQIALRKGQSTNWSAFTKNIDKELKRQHKILYKNK